MPLFDRNKIVVTCDFDDNIVVVGGSIRGTVNIYVLETVTLCGASLRYHVDESCFSHETDHRTSRPIFEKKCAFEIEYVLFGHRSTKKNVPPVLVKSGHYRYPFVIPVPTNCPPSTAYGDPNSSLKRREGKNISIRVDHRVDVNVYVAYSLMDKQTTYTVPMVVKCTSPALLLSPSNGREGHLKKGLSTTFSKGGLLKGLFGSAIASKTAEQAECDLFVYNTAVSLAETPFLHFCIRGQINSPYYVSLVRVTSYGVNNTSLAPPRSVTEEVVSIVMMPPLDANEVGVKGRLVISPHALQSSTSFSGRFMACQFFVTLTLIYASGIDCGIPHEHALRIPIDVSHGSLAEEAVPGVVADTISDGAIMAYTCPEGCGGDFAPIAPVTEGGVGPAAWGGSQMRYNRQVANGNTTAAPQNNNNNGNTTAANGVIFSSPPPPAPAAAPQLQHQPYLAGPPAPGQHGAVTAGMPVAFAAPQSSAANRPPFAMNAGSGGYQNGYEGGHQHHHQQQHYGAFAPPSTTYPTIPNGNNNNNQQRGSERASAAYAYPPIGNNNNNNNNYSAASRGPVASPNNTNNNNDMRQASSPAPAMVVFHSESTNSLEGAEEVLQVTPTGPIYDENGRPIRGHVNHEAGPNGGSSACTAAPLPPQ